MMGTSAQRVYSLIIEFLNTDVSRPPPDKYRRVPLDELFQKMLLAKIVDNFLIKTKNDEIEIFNAVADAYSTKHGIENFIEFKEILEKEKQTGFVGLAAMLETRRKFYNKQSSVY